MEFRRVLFRSPENKGFHLYSVKGHDYHELMQTYKKASETCRKTHSPCIIHVSEMTQPQGHSTSGSHERYKSKERLDYEQEVDCIAKMREWILHDEIAKPKEIELLEKDITNKVELLRQEAWEEYRKPIEQEKYDIIKLFSKIGKDDLSPLSQKIRNIPNILRKNLQGALHEATWLLRSKQMNPPEELLSYLDSYKIENRKRYNSHLFASEEHSPLTITEVKASYTKDAIKLDGRQIIQKFFDIKLGEDPRIFIFGEDVGVLGGVNLEFEGLHQKYSDLRVTDTGIREATILGQGIGAAMRGLKPIADIQYLDYLIYAIQGMSDDLATLRYRTSGGQAAPLIVRTKGHRLEGIWHTGSPLGMILGSLRGIHICVPRNSVQAAGLYQTLLQGDDPALVIEVLNSFRVKEKCPENLGSFNIPLGIPEILLEGKDITLVTYGANCAIALQAAKVLEKFSIHIEVIDVQTLLPFDIKKIIKRSIEKTNAVIFLDEDVPGGSTAFMMQQVLDKHAAYDFLDAPPKTLSAHDHRSAYGSDGDYFSKPNVEDIVNLSYEIMNERNPKKFPS